MIVRVVCVVNRWQTNAAMPADKKPGFTEVALDSHLRWIGPRQGFVPVKNSVHHGKITWAG